MYGLLVERERLKWLLSPIFIAILLSSMLAVYSLKSSKTNEIQNWTRAGAIYVQPSSPQNPFQFYSPYYDHLNSWWNLDFSAFTSQKYFDEMMLNRALSDYRSKAVAIHFPQFRADVQIFGTKYLQELEEVIAFFYEKGFHILLFIGWTDTNAYGFIDSIKDLAARTYLLSNVDRIIHYGQIPKYVNEVSLYWMAAVSDYSPEEVSEYNRQIKNLVNAAGDVFLVHVDGSWWDNNLNQNGYTPQSVSPKFGCSDGLFAESWSQGSLPNGLNKLIPEYFNSSQITMICDVPNGYLNPRQSNSHSTVEEDMDWWFECIESFGITSWYMWDYYMVGTDVPSTFSLIYPNATTLTRKGEFVRSITQTGIPYRDVAITDFEKYRTVLGQGSNTKINLTILNQGDFSETVNITVYANTTVLRTQNVTLNSGEFEKIDRLWNATLPLGNYTLRAEASMGGDVDTSDNIIVSGLITITIPGDVNADGRVDILDVAIAARAFGTRKGNERWNANADVNEDGTINILDISIIAKEYGKTA